MRASRQKPLSRAKIVLPDDVKAGLVMSSAHRVICRGYQMGQADAAAKESLVAGISPEPLAGRQQGHEADRPSCKWSDLVKFVAIIFMVVVLSAAQLALFARNSFRHFEYTCFFTKDEVMEGDEVGLVEIVSNRNGFPLPWLKSELSTSRWLEYAGSQSEVVGGPPYVQLFSH